MNALIAYYNGDEYGTDGWWEEGSGSAEIAARAYSGACACGFDTAPDLVEVETAKLSSLPSDEWTDLYYQWRMSRRNGWTSAEVDAAIEAEQIRRDNTTP